MDQNRETDNYDDMVEFPDEAENGESESVDDFIRQLEEKEKDLHITADTTFIEIAHNFDGEMPDFLAQAVAENGIQTVQSAVPPAPSGDSVLKSEVAALTAKLSVMEAERAEIFSNSQRRSKDFEAYKTRTERERREIFQNQLSVLATKMLPPLDNLDRALAFASETPQEKRSEFQQFFDGIVLVSKQINDVFAAMGIVPIPAVGEVFDPYLHEAVAIHEDINCPPNTVTEELLRGYSIGEKVVRHSMVKVSKSVAPFYGEIDIAVGAKAGHVESDPTSESE